MGDVLFGDSKEWVEQASGNCDLDLPKWAVDGRQGLAPRSKQQRRPVRTDPYQGASPRNRCTLLGHLEEVRGCGGKVTDPGQKALERLGSETATPLADDEHHGPRPGAQVGEKRSPSVVPVDEHRPAQRHAALWHLDRSQTVEQPTVHHPGLGSALREVGQSVASDGEQRANLQCGRRCDRLVRQGLLVGDERADGDHPDQSLVDAPRWGIDGVPVEAGTLLGTVR